MTDDSLLKLVDPWHVEERDPLLETRMFSVKQRECTSPTDTARTGTFVYLDLADWVNVIAITPDNRIVLVEQFRHGTTEVTLEIPGGLLDPGESPKEAGLRELAEETGYTGTDAELIGSVTPNPAIQNNVAHTLLVRGATQTREQAPDPNEELAVRLASRADVDACMRQGVIHHALVLAAFQHLTLREG